MKEEKKNTDFNEIIVFTLGILVYFIFSAIRKSEPLLMIVGLITSIMIFFQFWMMFRILNFINRTKKNRVIALIATVIIVFLETKIVISLLS